MVVLEDKAKSVKRFRFASDYRGNSSRRQLGLYFCLLTEYNRRMVDLSRMRSPEGHCRISLPTICTLLVLIGFNLAPLPAAEPQFRELAHFGAKEAHQGVAVDGQHFYAIASAAIGKYELSTGKRVARWASTKETPLKHLNGGVVFEGRLYCAHSNWPLLPRVSSIEIWKTDQLERVRSISFDKADGALNWLDRRAGVWYGVFAHYGHGADATAKDHISRTQLVKFDADWKPVQAWTFPENVWKRFAPTSNSGGSFAADGTLYCTGHDRAELYALRLPKAGGVLEYIETIPAPIAGQGIAWRLKPAAQLFGIRRAQREVVQMEFVP
jgi:hypothetical protein